MKKIINNMSGVTLLAVTITLIVLLILAGVTSYIIVYQNELLENAMNAKTTSTIVEEIDLLNTAYAATTIGQTSKITINNDTALKLEEELSKNVDKITVNVEINADGIKGFLVKFNSTGHLYFIENGEIKPTTPQEFYKNITPIYAILYKKTNLEGINEYDLRFNTTNIVHEDNDWVKLQEFGEISEQNMTITPWDSYKTVITSITFEEKIVPKYTAHWFDHCINLTTINNIGKLHTHHVTDMSYMFNHCRNLESLDISKFDTSNVTNMDSMFSNCYSLTDLELNNFVTSNVTNMNCMFQQCTSLTYLNLSNFDTSKVTNMYSIFANSDNLKIIDMRNSDLNIEDSTNNYTYMFSNLNPSIKIIVKNTIIQQFVQNQLGINNGTVTTVSQLITE